MDENGDGIHCPPSVLDSDTAEPKIARCALRDQGGAHLGVRVMISNRKILAWLTPVDTGLPQLTPVDVLIKRAKRTHRSPDPSLPQRRCHFSGNANSKQRSPRKLTPVNPRL